MARSAADRLLAVLDAFRPERSALTLTEIGARAGLPLATAHRLGAWAELAQASLDLGAIAPSGSAAAIATTHRHRLVCPCFNTRSR